MLLGPAGSVAAIAGLPPLGVLDHRVAGPAGLVLAVAGVLAILAHNPIFTAMTVTSLGITLMTSNLISLAATLVLVVSVQLQVPGTGPEQATGTRTSIAGSLSTTKRTGATAGLP